MWPYQTHRNLPPVPKGYPLAPFGSWFSVVVPIARRNEVQNPSFETGTTSWTAIGGSIAQSSAWQYHGAYSLAITPTAATTDGARYDTVSMTASQLYAYSAKFYTPTAGQKYKLCVETTGGAELASVTFTATGRPQWIYGYWQETSSTTRRITIRKANHASTAVFYLDGVQVEAINTGEFVSTYIDGDQLGLVPNQFPAAYVWSGTPHASTSSRSGQTRAGGMVMRLDYYGFVLTAIVGLGLITPNNVSVPYVQLDGAQYERTQKPPRQFTLAGRWDSASFPNLQRQMSDLGAALDRDYIGQQQPLTLLYQGIDDCGRAFSDTGRLICSYQGGLEGATDNLHSEQASIVMRAWLPLIQGDGEIGATLTPQQNVANANGVLVRSSAGVWSAVGTGIAGGSQTVNASARTLDNKIIIGGTYASLNGVANTNMIAQYDPATGTVSAMGSGSGGGTGVFGFARGPSGNIVAVGTFVNMGGVAAADSVGNWNGSAWSAFGVYPGAAAQAATYDAFGILYVVESSTGKVYTWNGSAWATSATFATTVYNITMAPDGYPTVIFSGAVSVGGVSSIAAHYNGSAWVGIPVGILTQGGRDLVYDAAGRLWVAGNGNGVWRYSGGGWTKVSTETDPITPVHYSITYATDGSIYVGGQFTGANGVSVAPGFLRIQGDSVLPRDITLPGTTIVYGVEQLDDGTLVVGFGSTGTAVAAVTTSITNPGTAKTYPRVMIKGPSSGTSRVYQITNITTGRAIYLSYTINAGETAILNFQPDNLSFVSDFQGNLINMIMGGSSLADFFLQPGTNIIQFFADSSTVTATLTARPQYNAIADLTP